MPPLLLISPLPTFPPIPCSIYPNQRKLVNYLFFHIKSNQSYAHLSHIPRSRCSAELIELFATSTPAWSMLFPWRAFLVPCIFNPDRKLLWATLNSSRYPNPFSAPSIYLHFCLGKPTNSHNQRMERIEIVVEGEQTQLPKVYINGKEHVAEVRNVYKAGQTPRVTDHWPGIHSEGQPEISDNCLPAIGDTGQMIHCSGTRTIRQDQGHKFPTLIDLSDMELRRYTSLSISPRYLYEHRTTLLLIYIKYINFLLRFPVPILST